MNKRCSCCRQTKPVSEFYKHPTTVDGIESRCIECLSLYGKRHRQTPRGKAVAAWNDLFKKIRQPEYAGIKVQLEREEFLAWAEREFEKWFKEHPGVRPSIDRIDPDGHYVMTNIRVISLIDNIRRKRDNRNVHAPEGQAWCARCLDYRPRQIFSICRRNFNGLQNHCRPCSNIRYKECMLRVKKRKELTVRGV